MYIITVNDPDFHGTNMLIERHGFKSLESALLYISANWHKWNSRFSVMIHFDYYYHDKDEF